MEAKVHSLLSRFADVEAELGHPDVFQDQKKYRELAQRYAALSDLKRAWESLEKYRRELADAKELLTMEEEPEFIAQLEEEIARLEVKCESEEKKVENLLVPPDPNDSCNTILELRAGTGGDEAALFVGDCVRMYKMYADRQGWRYEELSGTASERGGYKEYVMVLSGSNVFRFLRHEGGTHRVQRVPETEAQGRVHTSAITVAVLLEPSDDSDVVIEEKDLRVDTYRSSGAGGQHVNTTDSAVRLTHIPTGIVVYCQEERSQHKNKDKAMRFLRAKIAEERMAKEIAERASDRQLQVGSGDRSGRIRTYNFSQNRVTDHRIGMTKYNLDRVMEGELDEFSLALLAHFHQEKVNSRDALS